MTDSAHPAPQEKAAPASRSGARRLDALLVKSRVEPLCDAERDEMWVLLGNSLPRPPPIRERDSDDHSKGAFVGLLGRIL